MISNFAILGLVFTVVVCFVVPLIAMAVLKIRMRAKILLFLAGISMQVLFVMLLERLFISLTVRAVPAITQYDSLYPIVMVLVAGIFESLEFALVVRVLRDHINAGSQAVMFGMGHAGANAVLSMGLTSIAYYSVAVIANANGADALTEGLSGEDLFFMQSMLEFMQSDAILFYISGVQQLMLIMVYCCAAVIMWMAMTERLSRKWAGVSVLMIAMITFFIQLDTRNYWIMLAFSLIIGIASVVFTRMLYVKIEGDHPRQERMPVRRLR